MFDEDGRAELNAAPTIIRYSVGFSSVIVNTAVKY